MYKTVQFVLSFFDFFQVSVRFFHFVKICNFLCYYAERGDKSEKGKQINRENSI